MIPIHRHDVCEQIEFFTKHPTIVARFHPWTIVPFSYYDQMKDAIRRNDVEYCREYFTAESINKRESKLMKWDDEVFIKGSGVYAHYWRKAVKYGRIEIMNVFYEVDKRAELPKYDASRESFSHGDLMKMIPNHVTLQWFLDTNYDKDVSSIWIKCITRAALKREDIDCLIWLHSYVPKIICHYPTPYTYLEYTIVNYKTVGGLNDLVKRIKDKRPKVLNWCRQQSWRMVIDWDHCIVT
jgi:hypothetical protein